MARRSIGVFPGEFDMRCQTRCPTRAERLVNLLTGLQSRMSAPLLLGYAAFHCESKLAPRQRHIDVAGVMPEGQRKSIDIGLLRVLVRLIRRLRF